MTELLIIPKAQALLLGTVRPDGRPTLKLFPLHEPSGRTIPVSNPPAEPLGEFEKRKLRSCYAFAMTQTPVPINTVPAIECAIFSRFIVLNRSRILRAANA